MDLGKLVWDTDFDITQTASQNRMIAICSDLRASNLVLNGEVDCWMENFKLYIVATDGAGGFPVTPANFNTKLTAYLANPSYKGAYYKKLNMIGFVGTNLKYSMINVISPSQAIGSNA